MKYTIGSNIQCPHCVTELEVEVEGFFTASIMSNTLKRLEEEGGTVTCGNCKQRFIVKSKKNESKVTFNKIKDFFNRK